MCNRLAFKRWSFKLRKWKEVFVFPSSFVLFRGLRLQIIHNFKELCKNEPLILIRNIPSFQLGPKSLWGRNTGTVRSHFHLLHGPLLCSCAGLIVSLFIIRWRWAQEKGCFSSDKLILLFYLFSQNHAEIHVMKVQIEWSKNRGIWGRFTSCARLWRIR